MRHNDESAAERVWKEKLEHCATREEAALLLILATVIAGLLLTVA